jgi:hypothetical protein
MTTNKGTAIAIECWIDKFDDFTRLSIALKRVKFGTAKDREG